MHEPRTVAAGRPYAARRRSRDPSPAADAGGRAGEIIVAENAANPQAERLQTLPGVGQILAPVLALEIDQVARLPTADKLCAYAGLVPTTDASGGKIAHGRMLPFCNRWLKWAFIEAALMAVGCADYFGSFYRKQRLRGKGAHDAITIVARRMATIAWKMLAHERDCTPQAPTATPATAAKALSPAALTKD